MEHGPVEVVEVVEVVEGVEVVEVVEVDVQSLTSSRTSDAKYGKDRCWNVDHI
jgi:hypothetical protein